MHHSRGFGVQSPRDYSFIRYVVNEHYPYYAYDDLRQALPDVRKRTRKLAELYFRIANYRQASVIVDCTPTDPVYARYFQAGCRKSAVKHSLDETDRVELLRVSADAADPSLTARIMDKVDERSMVIVEGIKRNRQSKAAWRQLASQEKVSVSFDLYYVGILFFDTDRYPQNYIINF